MISYGNPRINVLERQPQELLSGNNQGSDIRAAEISRAQNRHETWGIAIEFDDTDRLIAAARTLRNAGYTRMDAYTPMPVEGLSEAIGFRNKQMPALMFLGAMLGGCSGYFMQWFANTQSYPLNLGGRPYHTWPNFIVITFEATILFSALTGVFGMLALNGLPTLYHPIYNTPRLRTRFAGPLLPGGRIARPAFRFRQNDGPDGEPRFAQRLGR